MSEVLVTQRNGIKRHLLASVSALALSVSISAISTAYADADESDHPPLWIELGGQFEQFSRESDLFAPPFISTYDWSAAKLTSPAATQDMRDFSVGGNASVSFHPADTNWVISAAVRYGRSNGSKHSHEQPPGPMLPTIFAYYSPGNGFHCCKTSTVKEFSSNFEDTRATHSEAHLVADFQAGKDVGLGMFGHESTSAFGVGIRFAQFHSRTTVIANAREDVQFYNYFAGLNYYQGRLYEAAERRHDFMLSGQSTRSFRGFGPSITWNASVPFIGNEENGEATIDWGANAALLFGRQKTDVQHQTTGQYHKPKYGNTVLYYPPAVKHVRARSVIVPNAGGFAGLSFRYADAKLSLGYRADFFFGAMDTGIDAAKRTTTGFYGPFANISVGIGG